MNIGLDVDGVLTDFEWFLDYYAKKLFKKKFKVEVCKYKFIDRFSCLPKDELRFYAKYLWHYIHKVSIREDAPAVIRKLNRQGNKIYIITARALASSDSNFISLMMRNILKKWLKKNGIGYDGIYFVSSSNSETEKCALAKQLNLDWFIEDDPYNICELAKITRVICITENYNLSIPNVQHALDFGEVFHLIMGDEMAILSFEERNKMPRDKREEYFDNLKRYYSTIPNDTSNLYKFRKKYIKIANIWKFIYRVIFKCDLIFENNMKFIDNAIYICDHKSALDIPILLYVLKAHTPRLLIKKELKGSLLGNILSEIGAVWVNRDSSISGKRAQNALIQTILNGGSILIFPEGTRNKTEQPLLPFRYGALYIAQITGVPIVPMAMKKNNKNSFSIKVAAPMYINKCDILEPKKEELQKIVTGLLGEMYSVSI